MTVDLQIRQDQLNSLDQFFVAALGMPQRLIIWNEKRLFRRSRHDASKKHYQGPQEFLRSALVGFWPDLFCGFF